MTQEYSTSALAPVYSAGSTSTMNPSVIMHCSYSSLESLVLKQVLEQVLKVLEEVELFSLEANHEVEQLGCLTTWNCCCCCCSRKMRSYRLCSKASPLAVNHVSGECKA